MEKPTFEEAKQAREVLLNYLPSPEYCSVEDIGEKEILWLMLKRIEYFN